MKLSEIGAFGADVCVVRDGFFDDMGLIPTLSEWKLLCFIEDEKYIPLLSSNAHIDCIITTKAAAEKIRDTTSYAVAWADNPRLQFFTLHNTLLAKTEFYRKKERSVIHASACIHPSTSIDEYNVRIGEGVVIGAHSIIHANTTIGNNVRIGDNCVVGGDGFECFRYGDSVFTVRSAGGVMIENNVDIHNNTCVDKAIFRGDTVLGEFSQFDNLIHIAHDVKIGKRTFVAAAAMIAGRVIIGDDVWIGPAASIRNGCTIDDNASVSMASVVTKSVDKEATVTGHFAIEHSRFIEFMRSIR